MQKIIFCVQIILPNLNIMWARPLLIFFFLLYFYYLFLLFLYSALNNFVSFNSLRFTTFEHFFYPFHANKKKKKKQIKWRWGNNASMLKVCHFQVLFYTFSKLLLFLFSFCLCNIYIFQFMELLRLSILFCFNLFTSVVVILMI